MQRITRAAARQAVESGVRVGKWHAEVWLALMRSAAFQVLEAVRIRQSTGLGSKAMQALEQRLVGAASKVFRTTKGANAKEPDDLKKLLLTPPAEVLGLVTFALAMAPKALFR